MYKRELKIEMEFNEELEINDYKIILITPYREEVLEVWETRERAEKEIEKLKNYFKIN